jgi:hypothetical protein
VCPVCFYKKYVRESQARSTPRPARPPRQTQVPLLLQVKLAAATPRIHMSASKKAAEKIRQAPSASVIAECNRLCDQVASLSGSSDKQKATTVLHLLKNKPSPYAVGVATALLGKVAKGHNRTVNCLMNEQSRLRDELQRVRDGLSAGEQFLSVCKGQTMFDQAGTELSQVTATLNQLKAKRDDLLENLKTASAQLTGPTGPAGKSWMVGL